MEPIKEKVNRRSPFRILKRFFVVLCLVFLSMLLFFTVLAATHNMSEEIVVIDNNENQCVMRVYDEDKFVCEPKYHGCSKGWSKPVLYLYPSVAQYIKVNLELDGELINTYPTYNNGWNVFVYPDGKIINSTDGKEYSYLFWEGISSEVIKYDFNQGFVIEGEDTAQFLQDKLSQLGLTPKEYNEFIVYWMPKMQSNKYNLIHFASEEEYDDHARLTINPKPDSVLRVFMVYKSLEEKQEAVPQEIKPFERKGFSVVEWGGSEVE